MSTIYDRAMKAREASSARAPAKSAKEELPKLKEQVASIPAKKRPMRSATTTLISLRLPNDLYDKMNDGPGWQTRVIEILRRNFA